MKFQLLISLMFLTCSSFGLLFAPCQNNAEAKEHAKTRGAKGKSSKKYICNFKTKEFYGKRKGALKRFYKGDACAWCGCSSGLHTDSGISIVPTVPVAGAPATKAPAKKPATKAPAKKPATKAPAKKPAQKAIKKK